MIVTPLLRKLRDDYRDHIRAYDDPQSFPLVIQAPIRRLPILDKVGPVRKPNRQYPPRFYCAACERHEKFWDGGAYLCNDGTVRLIGNKCEKDPELQQQLVKADTSFALDMRAELYRSMRDGTVRVLTRLRSELDEIMETEQHAMLEKLERELAQFARKLPALHGAITTAVAAGEPLVLRRAATTKARQYMGRRRAAPDDVISFRHVVEGGQVLTARHLAKGLDLAKQALATLSTDLEWSRTAMLAEQTDQIRFERLLRAALSVVEAIQRVATAVEHAIAFFRPTNLEGIVAYAKGRRELALATGDYRLTSRGFRFEPESGADVVIAAPQPLARLSLPALADATALIDDWRRGTSSAP